MTIGITEEEFDTYQESGASDESREKTIDNINTGRSMEDALESAYGKVLTKDLDKILVEKLDAIVRFKHDKDKSVDQNYANICALILAYGVACDVKTRQDNAIKTMHASYKKIKTVSEKVKFKANGGRR